MWLVTTWAAASYPAIGSPSPRRRKRQPHKTAVDANDYIQLQKLAAGPFATEDRSLSLGSRLRQKRTRQSCFIKTKEQNSPGQSNAGEETLGWQTKPGAFQRTAPTRMVTQVHNKTQYKKKKATLPNLGTMESDN
ncbi:hypothetical protein LX36DRAFT_188664 [Colletotrichum falcatum]|nr:hypothetical protein LX36DRAFT_188664 [Colletotrichum falcatum]